MVGRGRGSHAGGSAHGLYELGSESLSLVPFEVLMLAIPLAKDCVRLAVLLVGGKDHVLVDRFGEPERSIRGKQEFQRGTVVVHVSPKTAQVGFELFTRGRPRLVVAGVSEGELVAIDREEPAVVGGLVVEHGSTDDELDLMIGVQTEHRIATSLLDSTRSDTPLHEFGERYVALLGAVEPNLELVALKRAEDADPVRIDALQVWRHDPQDGVDSRFTLTQLAHWKSPLVCGFGQLI